jgi:hypothetical protein
MEDDGSVNTYNTSESLATFIAGQVGPFAGLIGPTLVRALYLGLTDSQAIAALVRDIIFRWCVHFFV